MNTAYKTYRILIILIQLLLGFIIEIFRHLGIFIAYFFSQPCVKSALKDAFIDGTRTGGILILVYGIMLGGLRGDLLIAGVLLGAGSFLFWFFIYLVRRC